MDRFVGDKVDGHGIDGNRHTGKKHPFPPLTLFRSFPDHLNVTPHRGDRITSSQSPGFPLALILVLYAEFTKAGYHK